MVAKERNRTTDTRIFSPDPKDQ